MNAARITGTGSAFPEKRLTNQDLSRILDTTDEWIRERTGISERRIADASRESERNSSLGTAAVRQALEMAGKRPEDIDAIFYATCTPDTLIPSTACWLQHRLGAKKAWGVDLNAACSGFVYGLSMADQFIRTGQIKTAVVVGSDILSAFTNWEDRGSCILFADGAGACVVESTSTDDPHRILSTHMRTEGDLWDLFQIPAGGSNAEVTPERHAQKLDKMQMKGREIFKVAVKTFAEFSQLALDANSLKLDQLDWFIPHQANLRIIESVVKRLELPPQKLLGNIEKFGNTSGATIPTSLDEAVRAGKIQSGHHVLLVALGAGLTYGSAMVRW